jgi:isopenicillin N synthase-like dioxygenase
MNQFRLSGTSEFDDNDLNIAALETIDFSRLATKDADEIDKLLKCCESDGFFYLNLQNEPTHQILIDLQAILRVMQKYFAQPLETKMRDDRRSNTHG